MNSLILGLIIFLGLHSIHVFSPDWRKQQMARFGEKPWKAAFALLSLLGFGLICWGYGEARLTPVVLWNPPTGVRHLVALLMLPAFALLVAAYVPRNALKARIGHPMVVSVKAWALAHLLANGTLADVLLFGSFLVWAALSFRACRQRDKASGTLYPASSMAGTAITLVVGAVAFVVFALVLHVRLIGVPPFG